MRHRDPSEKGAVLRSGWGDRGGGRIGDQELKGNAPSLAEEAPRRRRLQVAVEEAREQPIGATILEGEQQRIAADMPRAWHAASRDGQHRLALVDRGDLPGG